MRKRVENHHFSLGGGGFLVETRKILGVSRVITIITQREREKPQQQSRL